jgi:hypothetical protein
MKTILKDEEATLEITDEGFDSPLSWLNITTKDRMTEDIVSIDIPLRELMGALIGFDAKRSRFEDEIKD